MQQLTSTLTPRGERWVRRTSRPLDILALIFLLDMLLIWAFPDAPEPAQRAMNLVAWTVWAGFAVDYLARLAMSTPKAVFVRTHRLDLLMILLPMLRMLRVFLLLRKSLAAVSTERIAGSILSIVSVVVVLAAFLEWRVEYDAPGANITSFRVALWWAVVTTTTVGYGDYTPITPAGRLIAMLVMIVGIGLIGTVSATVASWFVSRPKAGELTAETQPAGDEEHVPDGDKAPHGGPQPQDPEHAELMARLDALAAQQDEIRTLLGQLQPGLRSD